MLWWLTMEDDELESIDVTMSMNVKTLVLLLFSSTVGCGISILLGISFSDSLFTAISGIVFGLTMGFIGNYFILTKIPFYTVKLIRNDADEEDEIDVYPSTMKLT